jgi:hypothetical protein
MPPLECPDSMRGDVVTIVTFYRPFLEVLLSITNSMAEVPALNLLAISAIETPISYNTELPKPDTTVL